MMGFVHSNYNNINQNNIYFSNRYDSKIQHLQIFLANKQVGGEKYVAKYVLTFIAMNHSGQFVHLSTPTFLRTCYTSEVVDLVDCCCKIYLVT
jgi:hypothetical protein